MKLYASIIICFNLLILIYVSVATKCDSSDEPLCEECKKDSTDCGLCRKYYKYNWEYDYVDCFDKCPNGTYGIPELYGRVNCVDCNQACDGGCNGNDTFVGPKGCNRCQYAIVEQDRNSSNYRCLNYLGFESEDVCSKNGLSGYYISPSSDTTKTEYECKKCDPLCVSCSNSTDVEKVKCVCAEGAAQQQINSSVHYVQTIDTQINLETTVLPTLITDEFTLITDKVPTLLTDKVPTLLTDKVPTLITDKVSDWSFGDFKNVMIIIMIVVSILTIVLTTLICVRKIKTVIYERININEIPENLIVEKNRYQILNKTKLIKGKKISEGNFGIVYKGKYNGINVAIKNLKNQKTPWSDMACEFSTMHMVSGKSKHLHALMGICIDDGEFLLVSELRMCSLKDYLRTNIKDLTTKDLVRYCYQIADGMQYLELQKIVHGDLAVRNILVKFKDHIEVSDFGLSRHLEGQQGVDYDGPVAVWWVAIECLEEFISTRRFKFTLKNDIWAYGITCWEIFSFALYDQNPYLSKEISSFETLIEFLRRGERLEHLPTCPSSCYQLMINSWCPEDKRMNFSQFYSEFVKILNKMDDLSQTTSISSNSSGCS